MQNCVPYFFPDTLAKVIIPVLLGLARAIGRSSDEGMPLISHLYPPSHVVSPKLRNIVREEEVRKKKSFSTFRPILPRTMSSNILVPESPPGSASSIGFFSDTLRQERSPSPLVASSKGEQTDDPLDASVHYFNQVGSSFTRTKAWGFEIIPEQDHLEFSSNQLQTILSMVSFLY